MKNSKYNLLRILDGYANIHLVRLTLLLLIVFQVVSCGVDKKDRPNILWITSEDNSIHYLSLYKKGGAPMPNVERLAKDGLVFNHVFSNAPVCSVARSTIISGSYVSRLFAHYHRSEKRAPLPKGLRMFPYYLKKAGYYTSNNSKEDYNFIKGEDVWDESSGKATYKNRKNGQPFFHVRSLKDTHESRLHPKLFDIKKKTQTDPKSFDLFPYHPDTQTFRQTAANYRDKHMQTDSAIGELLMELEKEGLMQDTIIFYYADHGGAMPRSKGYAYESGLHVPMVVYIPEKWKHLFPAERGSRVDGFVEFVDLAPTVLALAGIKAPKQMDGRPFLGKGVKLKELNARDETLGYADRFDEKYDLVRTLRKGNLKYMRNYQPFNFDGLHSFYRYIQLAYLEWRDLYKEGKLTDVQKGFFERRLPEALYDLDKDPHETKNLIADPAYREDLKSLRAKLQERVRGMPDLSMFPEPYLLKAAIGDPLQFGQDKKEEISKLLAIADLQLLPFNEAREGISQALESSDPWKRYWGLIVCSSFAKEAAGFIEKAKQISLEDENLLVRTRAAEFLGLIQAMDPRPVLYECLKMSKGLTESNLILNTIALLHSSELGYPFKIKKEMLHDQSWLDKKGNLVKERFLYINGDV